MIEKLDKETARKMFEYYFDLNNNCYFCIECAENAETFKSDFVLINSLSIASDLASGLSRAPKLKPFKCDKCGEHLPNWESGGFARIEEGD